MTAMGRFSNRPLWGCQSPMLAFRMDMLDGLAEAWLQFTEYLSRDRPWWVWACLALSPLLILGLLLGVAWLLFR
jgi:hypothetical protein